MGEGCAPDGDDGRFFVVSGGKQIREGGGRGLVPAHPGRALNALLDGDSDPHAQGRGRSRRPRPSQSQSAHGPAELRALAESHDGCGCNVRQQPVESAPTVAQGVSFGPRQSADSGFGGYLKC